MRKGVAVLKLLSVLKIMKLKLSQFKANKINHHLTAAKTRSKRPNPASITLQ